MIDVLGSWIMVLGEDPFLDHTELRPTSTREKVFLDHLETDQRERCFIPNCLPL